MVSNGFLKIAAASPRMKLGDALGNAREIIAQWRVADGRAAAVAVFPELALTGSTCRDMFLQSSLAEGAGRALETLLAASRDFRCAALVGLPLAALGKLYNAAALIAQGKLILIAPKVPDAYQARWFDCYEGPRREIEVCGQRVPFGGRLADLFGVTCAVAFDDAELTDLARRGAELILVPLAQKAEAGQYARFIYNYASLAAVNHCAVALASAGPGESSSQGVYPGDCAIIEGETVLSRGARYQFDGQLVLADADVSGIAYARHGKRAFRAVNPDEAVKVPLDPPDYSFERDADRVLSRHPFFKDEAVVYEDAFLMQVTALKRRVTHIGADKVVLGWSGGLDSTAALLAAHRALFELGLPAANVIAVSMPGIATSARTKTSSRDLARILGSTYMEIDISDMCLSELLAIGHDGKTPDVTFENVQARRRTGIVLNIANLRGALQLGTGDLSELALGWCTYGGDQTGMYGVNGGIPKTMLQGMIRWQAFAPGNEPMRETLLGILSTPISPELKPGEQMQSTEETLGHYELHDFFLYHLLVRGADRAKLSMLANKAFASRRTPEEIQRALGIFFGRLYAAQYKRATAPEGPQILQAGLSGDGWLQPSDY